MISVEIWQNKSELCYLENPLTRLAKILGLWDCLENWSASTYPQIVQLPIVSLTAGYVCCFYWVLDRKGVPISLYGIFCANRKYGMFLLLLPSNPISERHMNSEIIKGRKGKVLAVLGLFLTCARVGSLIVHQSRTTPKGAEICFLSPYPPSESAKMEIREVGL